MCKLVLKQVLAGSKVRQITTNSSTGIASTAKIFEIFVEKDTKFDNSTINLFHTSPRTPTEKQRHGIKRRRRNRRG